MSVISEDEKYVNRNSLAPNATTQVAKDRDARPDNFEDEKSLKDINDNASRFPMREVRFNLFGSPVIMNPIVSLIGLVILWGAAIYCMVDPDGAKETLLNGRAGTSHYFSWFQIATQAFFVFFSIFLAIRYGDIKLGNQDDEPEFSTPTFFALLFSAGVAVGLFFYGVAEPMWHKLDNWYANSAYHTQDEIDQYALALTIYHWGFAAWGCYVIVALAMGIGAYKFGLPLTLRSAFFPLLGGRTWGWLGDVIDGVTIVVIVSGVCTSLGLGAQQIVEGLARVELINTPAEGDNGSAIATIWVVTGIATISVVSGLNYGIKILSELAFGLGCVLLLLVFISDNSPYLLNVMVQLVGDYIQMGVFKQNFHTDAFGQLVSGEGRAMDGMSAQAGWVDGWTNFYFAWWTAWSSFVGLFIARISRGRTVREVVIFSLIAPTLYAIIWFGTFGGAGLRSSRVAEELQFLGKLQANEEALYSIDGNCYSFPEQTSFQFLYAPAENNSLTVMDMTGQDYLVEDYPGYTEWTFTNSLPGISKACLGAKSGPEAWFNLLESYPFGKFISILSIVAIAIYFVTSSDSGSLIVDHLASNGHEAHVIQRIFWAFTEGALATALLSAGGESALQGLQAASIIAGLPFTFLLVWMCQALWKMLDVVEKSLEGPVEPTKTFAQPLFGGVLDIFEFIFSGFSIPEERRELGMEFPSPKRISEFFVALALPWLTILRLRRKLYPDGKSMVSNIGLAVIGGACLYVGIILFFVTLHDPDVLAFAWILVLAFVFQVAVLRSTVRGRFDIDGNVISDITAAFFIYPQVLSQCAVQLLHDGEEVVDFPIETVEIP